MGKEAWDNMTAIAITGLSLGLLVGWYVRGKVHHGLRHMARKVNKY